MAAQYLQHEFSSTRIGRLPSNSINRTFDLLYESENQFLFRDHLRMSKASFDALYLRCAQHIPPKIKYKKEVIAAALGWLGSDALCRQQEITFPLAFSTIHKYRMIGLRSILKELGDPIQFLPENSTTSNIGPSKHFGRAVGPIDGAHTPTMVAASDTERFRNRKGSVPTNVLLGCDWDMNITFAFAGVEGSAHDSKVLALSGLLQQLPDSCYLLGDAGFALGTKLLTPYRSVRYHLNEWAATELGRPQLQRELFNYRHAHARNVVERVIGCLKRRFKILWLPIECEFRVTKAIIFACVCLHNFIQSETSHAVEANELEQSRVAVHHCVCDMHGNCDNWRNLLAEQMWKEYTSHPGEDV